MTHHKSLRTIVTLVAAALALLLSLPGESQNTTRQGRLRAREAAQTQSSEPAGSRVIVSPDQQVLRVSGYDKPLRSRRETFFASNRGSTDTIHALILTMTYSDADGKMLHKRHERVSCEIPPQETRQLSLRSWDTQQAFYYVRSEVPTRAQQATSFDVVLTVDSLMVH